MPLPLLTSSSIGRRTVLAYAAGGLAAPAFGARAATSDTPFTLGVASGCPRPDGFVLWTRLAPDPLAADGAGGLRGDVPVTWEIAADDRMARVVQRGVATARDRLAHSIHIEATALQPNRPYWYRFTAAGHQSPIGRARTAPRPEMDLQRLRFAFASCSHWEAGYFSAYRHMAAEAPDLVLFLGDYFYEGDEGGQKVRAHDGPEPVDLAGYRKRHALYKTDPDLQALHAAAPCLATWDDHEVENDYADRWSAHPETDPAAFLRRRAAAYQAYYEHMPLPRSAIPRGPDMRVYDRFTFGRLAEFNVLDGRQYRDMEACPAPTGRGGRVVADSCTERTDPRRSMLGSAQEGWLTDGFKQSHSRWNLMAQDVLVAQLLQKDAKTGLIGHHTDSWDGYAACRGRVLDAIDRSGLANPIFFGGDIHSFWTTDLKADFDDPRSKTIATEFVGTSITSDGVDYDLFAQMLPRNPHVRFFESRYRGYVAVDLTPKRMEVKFQAISDRRDPAATVSTLRSFVVEDGRAGASA